jgi:membrane associated rhomboid family serine protease
MTGKEDDAAEPICDDMECMQQPICETTPMEQEPDIAATEVWRAVPAKLDAPASLTTLSGRRLHNWLLVLEARGVPCRAERGGLGWRLLVPDDRFEIAREELRRFEAENRNWPPPLPPQAPFADNRLATVSVLLLLATFHNLTLLDLELPGHHPVDWITLGNAHAELILVGQWWRPVTALTLHAGWLHLLGNLTLGGIFMVRLCRDLGSGLAWNLLLAAGCLGNLANACLQQPDHRAVGASTAVFGAVGLLAALSLVNYRHQLRRRWPLPVAAALGLLALLGSEGERTDLGAHIFGFAFGILLGLATGLLLERCGRPGRRLNALLALVSASVVLGAWWAALVFGG